MGKRVTGPSRIQKTNDNIIFVMYIFHEGKPMKVVPWMMGYFYLARHRDVNNTCNLKSNKDV